MSPSFLETADQVDPSLPVDTRPQPWRKYWPKKKEEYREDKAELPIWMVYKFDASPFGDSFGKPWEKWELGWPKTPNKDAPPPVPKYEPDFIRQRVEAISLSDPLKAWNPQRTNTYLQFFAPTPSLEGEKPYYLRGIPRFSEDQRQNNFGGRYDKVMLTDVRGHEDKFTLDRDGFSFASHKSSIAREGPFDKKEYIEEMTKWLQTYLGCSEVLVFDATVRSQDSKNEPSKKHNAADIARKVHCDQTPRSSIARIKLHYPDRADSLLKKRCRILNVWRPLTSPVTNTPLAYCSFTSIVPSRDLISADNILPHFGAESFEVTPHDEHRWYYQSLQRDDEVTLLKIFDSKIGTAFGTPHSGFEDPRGPLPVQTRMSIELRCLVFGDDDSKVLSKL